LTLPGWHTGNDAENAGLEKAGPS